MSIRLKVSTLESQDYRDCRTEKGLQGISHIAVDSMDQSLLSALESSGDTSEQLRKSSRKEREEVIVGSRRESGRSVSTLDVDGPMVAPFQQLQAASSATREFSKISSTEEQSYHVAPRTSQEEKKSMSPAAPVLDTHNGAMGRFSFADETDEHQNPMFHLESFGRDDNGARCVEETTEWLLHDGNTEKSSKMPRPAALDNVINELPSSVMSPPSSLYYISPSPHLNGRDGDEETLNSSVSSQHLSNIMNTPPGSASLSTSNAGSLHPVLYSAIGSLEKCSATSFGKVRIQHNAMSNRNFDRPATAQTLIPPESKPASTRTTRHLPDARKATLIKPLKMASEIDRSKRVANVKFQTAENTKNATPAVDACIAGAKTERRKPKKVTIKDSLKGESKSRKPVEMFRPSCDAYTPRMEKKKIKYKPAEMRTPVQKMSSTMGTLARPNFRDALRRVAMILQQHITKIERRFELAGANFIGDGLFQTAMREAFSEDKYSTPRYKCTMVRIPMARPGMVYGLRKLRPIYSVPSEQEIYDFGHKLFQSVQLSSECSIVCLIYVERLMEIAKVPLLASTWRPIFMCGLLLASKVWQDLSSWNIEFASVYPQFSLEAINKLELEFLRMVKWDLYISSSLYAKYYFALRSLLEKQDFRMRYNRMVGGVGSVDVSEALKVQQRSERVKEEALMQLSRSM